MSQKILVVDDEPHIVELVKYNLLQEGFDVLSASDGSQGLAPGPRHPGHHAALYRRTGSLPADPPRVLGPHHHAHGQRWGTGTRRRIGDRAARLWNQAVQPARPLAAAAGGRPPRAE